MPAADLPGRPGAEPPRPVPSLAGLLAEAQRQLTICNSCRYCEGYCAVFPAVERHTEVATADIPHLANLCHDCRACYYACMYAPPHEFGVNPPAILGQVRRATYRTYISRPRWLARLAGREGTGRGRPWREITVAAALVAGLVVALAAVTEGVGALWGTRHPAGSPYSVIPYPALLLTVALPSVWSVVLLLRAAGRYWRDTHGPLRDLADPRALARAAGYAASLRYLRGGGEGCYYPADVPAPARRYLHAAVAWGFAACFAATVSAAILQDFLGVPPPYPLLSAPVLLGTGGGLALAAGCAGLIALKHRSDPVPAPDEAVAGYGLLIGLAALAVTGLLTLLLRTTSAFGLILVVHLTTIVVCLALAPYTSFPHFIYRSLAILHDNLTAPRPPQRAPKSGQSTSGKQRGLTTFRQARRASSGPDQPEPGSR